MLIPKRYRTAVRTTLMAAILESIANLINSGYDVEDMKIFTEEMRNAADEVDEWIQKEIENV